MKLLSMLSVLSVSAFSCLATAQSAPTVVTIDGSKAKQVMQAMDGSSNTQWLENTVGVTILKNGNVTCTLIGSHGGSPRFKNPIYSCDIAL